MHLGGPRAHRVAVLTTFVWAGLMLAGVVPATSTPHQPAARAEAAVAPRPALHELIMNSGPTAYWPLQDVSPTIARDETGLHDGTGSPAVRVRQVGQGPGTVSEAFDGGSAQVIAPATGALAAPAAVSAWLRTPRRPAATFGAVVSTGGLSLLVAGGRAVGATCAAQGGCRSVTSPGSVTDGAWHQVALSTHQGVATLYVDGQQSGAVPIVAADATDPGVVIGRGFPGNIDNVAVFAHPLTAADIATEFGAGACPQAAGTVAAPTLTSATLPALPLHTSGRWILDARDRRVKLAGVNWYGAEELDGVPSGLQCQSADAIAAHIAASGFNVVRLPWATNDWIGAPPAVPPIAVAGDPSLRGMDGRAVFDAVIAALGRHGVMVLLDNHVGRPDWCCTTGDGNALWWTSYDPAHAPTWHTRTWHGKLRLFFRGQSRWLAAWRAITSRYAPTGPHPQANVIGADLRNEPRPDTTLRLPIAWRGGKVPVWLDWPRAAQKAGDAVLRLNPRLLVVVEGIDYGTRLQGVATRPVRLSTAHRLVYSAHDYSWEHASAAAVRGDLGRSWGWLLTQQRWWTTPVLVGEYGSCHPENAECGDGPWLTAFRRYLADTDVDWAYWALNGTSARASAEPTTCGPTPRAPGCEEGYGVMTTDWSGNASAALTGVLDGLEPATQGP